MGGKCGLDEVDADCGCKGAIVEAITEITPIVWQAPADIVIHATPWSEHSIAFPAVQTLPRVAIVCCHHLRFLRFVAITSHFVAG